MTSTSIVVARFDEDVRWLVSGPSGPTYSWPNFIYNKGVSDAEGFFMIEGLKFVGESLPNIGREANSYLHHIVNHYDSLCDEVVFCQGNPFDHDPSFLDHLSNDSIRHYGILWECPSEGELQMTMHGLGLLDEYCRVFGLPVQPKYKFSTGAQYRVTGDQIRARPLPFYEALLAITKLDQCSPYRLERLWPIIWGIDL